MSYEWRLAVKYDPSQPREPAGGPGGGRWISSGRGRWKARITLDDLNELGASKLAYEPENEAHKWASDLFREQLDSLWWQDRDLLKRYKDDGEWLNRPLREGRKPLEATLMDYILDRSMVPENIVVYKGLKERFRPSLIPGDIIELPDYSSTSLTPRVSPSFGIGWMEIRVPKGAKGLYIEPIENRGELELLLPRNQRFKVLESKTITVGGEEWPYALLEVIP